MYNFINDVAFENLYAEQIATIKVIHYLKTGKFDRAALFASSEVYQAFLQMNLAGVDQIFQTHVRKLWGNCPPHLALDA